MESLLQVLPAKPTGQELLTLLDAVGQRKGQVLVMEMDDAHERVSPVRVAFARELFSRADLGTELLRDEASKEREQELRPQLVFMLWQAATLRQLVQWELLDETLGNLRSLFPCVPAALVLVLIQPGLRHQQVEPEQAAGVLRRMQCLLDSSFQDLVVEAAVYSPGQLEGAWEVKRAACRALGEVLMEREGMTGVRSLKGRQSGGGTWVLGFNQPVVGEGRCGRSGIITVWVCWARHRISKCLPVGRHTSRSVTIKAGPAARGGVVEEDFSWL